MFGHLPELVIILVLGLIVFGPEKLPEMAANAGRMVREAREMASSVMNPEDTEIPDDFSTYYYESLARSGEDIPDTEEYEELEDEELGVNHWAEEDGEDSEVDLNRSDAHAGESHPE